MYDEFSSSYDNEDEEDCLPQNNFFLDPVEEEVILVETYLLNIPNQALFQDPYVDFLKTSEEGIKVADSSISPSATKKFQSCCQETESMGMPLSVLHVRRDEQRPVMEPSD